MIRLVIRTTAILLSIGAVLVIVGLFDAFLGWNIFSQSVENFLYGVFFSCLVLAGVGIALSFVLGLLEIVEIMRASHEGRVLPPPPRLGYFAKRSVLGVSALVGLLIALSLVNAGVQEHRQGVFRQLVQQQTQQLSPKIASFLPSDLAAPTASSQLQQAFETLTRSELVWSATLYLPDPSDTDALWYYNNQTRYSVPDNQSENEIPFERLFVAKRLEELISNAFEGQQESLENYNKTNSFVWLEPIEQNNVQGVIYLEGNSEADLRDYSL
ncbi:MAG: hypothetical protein AAF821_05955 [Cyanobacteria bacterium P01_D01_bin.156]